MATVGGAPESMAQHWDLLWYVLTAAAGVIVGLAGLLNAMAWRIISRLEKTVERTSEQFQQFLKDCGNCKLEQNNKFVGRHEFDEWKDGRLEPGGLWDTLNHHRHDKDGNVVRTTK